MVCSKVVHYIVYLPHSAEIIKAQTMYIAIVVILVALMRAVLTENGICY